MFWAYNYTSALNLIELWRGTIDTAAAAYDVYLTLMTFYYSHMAVNNITYANVKTHYAKKIGIIDLGVEVNGIEKLTSVINAFQSLPDVHSVKRIQMNSKIKAPVENKKKTKQKKQ